MLNQCVLTGNLGADPEVFYSSEGNMIASFNIAFHSSKKKTGWILILPRWIHFRKVGLEIFKYSIASLVVRTSSFSFIDIGLPPIS